MIIAAIISLGEAGGSHPDDVQDWIEVGFHDVSVFALLSTPAVSGLHTLTDTTDHSNLCCA